MGSYLAGKIVERKEYMPLLSLHLPETKVSVRYWWTPWSILPAVLEVPCSPWRWATAIDQLSTFTVAKVSNSMASNFAIIRTAGMLCLCTNS